MSDESQYYRKEPRQSRSRAVVSALLTAAEQLLERSTDPTELPVQGIAARAGVGIGSLYDYFANGEGLWGVFLSRLSRSNYVALEQVIEGMNDEPFDRMLERLVDAVWDVYMARPAHTRGVIVTIFRLQQAGVVVRDRDRFAALVGRRLQRELPSLPEAEVRLTAEVLCAAVMGVLAAELWRERTPEQLQLVRKHLYQLTSAHIERVRALL
jgi:AcrR family transcriptional regulator